MWKPQWIDQRAENVVGQQPDPCDFDNSLEESRSGSVVPYAQDFVILPHHGCEYSSICPSRYQMRFQPHVVTAWEAGHRDIQMAAGAAMVIQPIKASGRIVEQLLDAMVM